MTMAISIAVERGAKVVICASTGNTSASAAAYAARAGLLCAVVIPEGQIALGKLAQALIHGARVVPVRGNFDHALDIVRELGERPGVEVVNSVNPVRIEGQKTAAFEIVDALGDAPDVHCLPVGNAGNITAYWQRLLRVPRLGRATRRPGCSAGRPRARRRSCSASRCCTPRRSPPRSGSATPRRGRARSRRATSRAGTSARSPTREILEAYRLLAADEGCFVEPASAASVAGLLQAAADGLVAADETVVCTVTGHGLKDPQRAISEVQVGEAVDADRRRGRGRAGLST